MAERRFPVSDRVDDLAVLLQPAFEDRTKRLVVFGNENPHATGAPVYDTDL